ncbi:hypothetical protein [Undibacterium umbellatum]|uniref:Uncharacterized protein n=1 Tax=Undibacterium umbellatum TaxID=2762300 RepID=A0ABR6ZFT8_9BURK|nr:hypothetical protein [Undibacterium umbellatum]MBC3910593.1 hypothetical protein [Undibacterium umbellatum]
MDGLLEFMFEAVPAASLPLLLRSLTGETANVVSINDYELGAQPVGAVFDELYWQAFFRRQGAACFMNLRVLQVGDKEVNGPSVQLMCSDMLLDVMVLMSSTDCRNAGLVLADDFATWMKDMAQLSDAQNFCGGLDPAWDVGTQLCSSRGIGPVMSL